MLIKLYVPGQWFDDVLRGREFMGSPYRETWTATKITEIYIKRSDIIGYPSDDIYVIRAGACFET